jgi:fatty acid desaturase
MSDRSNQTEHIDAHRVRPRWVWIALAMMIAGLVLIGIGIIVLSWIWAVIGIIVLVVGGVAGIYGGFFYDVQSRTTPDTELADAAKGEERMAPGPGTRRSLRRLEADHPRRRRED